MIPKRASLIVLLALATVACDRSGESPMLGTLEWDRVAVAAEVSEPILRIAVREGDSAKAGDAILMLDPRRTDADLAQASAEARKATAALDELRHGSRIETIDAARAALAGTVSTQNNARRERDRIAEIRKRGLIAQADLDDAETALRTATAQANSARANLDELLHGTRIEDIEQAEAALAAAEAAVQRLSLTRARLDVRAPVDGRIDALPFKLGDQPPIGATLVSLLSGTAPYARIYVPASRRARLAQGTRCRVQVQGIDGSFAATIRSLRSDPAFTPYFALTGDDASRLAYRAELVLDGDAAKKLPAGLPVQAECDAHGG
ncbi:MAG TPA: HlyD family efflux transporter periplasmic adaptor subunit [Rhodanobacteraceae bacterium]|jgi:HlyD family secretion protein|nr:HlyD family efflux transporter periplasmic adaptor subunit [Rhodanobacteraceae bacterium]